jgi:predicted nucleic acid-binding protein
MPAVVDTTVLSNFAHVQKPELLRSALEQGSTTPQVLRELTIGEQTGRLPICDWSWLPVLDLSGSERALAADFARQTDLGEAECLAVALSRQWMFLSDDQAARRIARLREVTVSGTLGVLARLVDTGRLPLGDADDLLLQMIARGYRSPIASLKELRAV